MQTSKVSYKHISNLMQAALPNVNTKSRNSMEIIIKASELLDSISNSSNHQISACDIADETVDMEALLRGLQPACNSAETETVNMLINFVKTQKLYRTYQNMREFLPQRESNQFTQTKLFPLIEQFFQLQKEQKERSET